KDVLKRWTNLRDAFVKSKRKLKDCEKRQEGLAEVEEEDAVPQRAHEDTEGATNTITGEANKRTTETPSTRARKHRKPDEIELRIMKALESEKPDNKMAFFNSLLPHLDTFDNNNFLQFQMGVLQLISNINEKKEDGTLASSFPHSFTYHPPPFSTQTSRFPSKLPSTSGMNVNVNYSQSSEVNSLEDSRENQG
ncbi:hypothetical protein NQ314_009221, partial [Rhamnusium bicolor]